MMPVFNQMNIALQEFADSPSKDLIFSQFIFLTELPELFILRFRDLEVLFVEFNLTRFLLPALRHSIRFKTNAC